MSERPNGDLPPEWEDLDREDSASLAPPAGAKDRVRRRVALTLGLGAGFLAATGASSSAAAAGAAGAGAGAAGGAGAGGGTGAAATGLAGTLLAKKALVIGVAAAVGVGGGTAAYLEVRSERARSRPPVVMPAPAPAPVASPVAPPAPEPLPAPVDTLGEEGALLDRARQEIAHGRLAEAGALLDRHAALFPAGQLAEEREALGIRLLVREGREAEARSRAARFRQQHPRSIQLPGIDEALRGRR